MPLIRAFRGLLAHPAHAADVVAPPYDVVSEQEARALAQGRPWSFLHVSRAEIDFPEGTDPSSAEVYARARESFDHMVGAGILERDAASCFYVYRLSAGGHRQTGLVAGVAAADYESGRIRRHELTRPAKEEDRARHIEALDAQTGPVLMVYRGRPSLEGFFERATQVPPQLEVTAQDGVRHSLWRVADPEQVRWLTETFGELDAFYIADGHHRSAAGVRVAEARRNANPLHTGGEEYAYLLAVLFPHDQMRILDYNRVVRDLAGLTARELIERLQRQFELAPAPSTVRPARKGELGMYLPGQWYRLRARFHRGVEGEAPLGLDVSLLEERVLRPILGIEDSRRDPRIDFVGGGRGLAALSTLVDRGGFAVAFSLFPTTVEELMAVSDAGAIMPPKSTWFEPKLADGLVCYPLS